MECGGVLDNFALPYDGGSILKSIFMWQCEGFTIITLGQLLGDMIVPWNLILPLAFSLTFILWSYWVLQQER